MSNPQVKTQFSSDQYSSVYPPGMQDNYWIKTRSKLIEGVIRELPESQGLILDIGCGPGFAVQHLAQAGFQCRGVDLGVPEVVSDVAGLIDTGILFEQLPRELRERVRSVLLLDVIEHLSDPSEMLKSLRQHLPNLQNVLITVPARGELWSNYDEFFGHYLRYSRAGLKALLDSCDLPIVKIQYFFHALYLPMVLLKLLSRPRKTSNQPPRPLWLHSLMARCLLFDARYLPGRLYGASLFAQIRISRESRVRGHE
jgi:hypothetical protein